jgi:hypothetical protein
MRAGRGRDGAAGGVRRRRQPLSTGAAHVGRARAIEPAGSRRVGRRAAGRIPPGPDGGGALSYRTVFESRRHGGSVRGARPGVERAGGAQDAAAGCSCGRAHDRALQAGDSAFAQNRTSERLPRVRPGAASRRRIVARHGLIPHDGVSGRRDAGRAAGARGPHETPHRRCRSWSRWRGRWTRRTRRA